MTASTRCKISLLCKKKTIRFQGEFCLRLICDEVIHHVTVSTVDLKWQNSLVCGENVTYHIFGGKKTHSNQTGGRDWIRDETSTLLVQCVCDIHIKKSNLIWFIQLYLYCICYNLGYPRVIYRNRPGQFLVHTCKDEGDLAGQLGSHRVASTESVSHAYACSNREAYGKLQGREEKASTESEPAIGWGCSLRRRSYHVGRRGQLIHDRLSRQLHLANDAGQESCNLIEPPLQAVHQHAGDGQFEERAPLLQALSGPAFSRGQNLFRVNSCSFLIIGLLHSDVHPLDNSSPWFCHIFMHGFTSPENQLASPRSPKNLVMASNSAEGLIKPSLFSKSPQLH